MSRPPPVPLDRVRALFAWWERRQPLGDARWDATAAAIVTRLDGDRHHYSDVFEPSFSWDGGGLRVRRFSYAFPGFRAAPDETARALAAFAAPWGGAVVEACARVARAARHDAVEQPLFGLADDRERGLRLKLYVQFRDGAANEAAALASAMTGARVEPARLSGALHMLGLDLGERGVAGAKLYIVPRAPFNTRAFIELPLSRILLVHRLDGPNAEFSSGAPDFDFSLAENGVTRRALLESASLQLHYSEALRAFTELDAAFAPVIRRVSLGTGPERKLTIYYALNAE